MRMIYLFNAFLSASNEESYVAWTNRLKTYFKDHDLWAIIEATTKPPMPEGDEIAFKAWSKKNALALYLIRESCGSNIFRFIGKINEAKQAWDTLAEKFKPGTDSTISPFFGKY